MHGRTDLQTRRWQGLAGPPVACALTLGCATAPAERPSVSTNPPLAVTTAPAPPSVPKLFVGDNGTCRVFGPGDVDCWGAITAGLVELARERRAVALAFPANAEERTPFCVLDEQARAYCRHQCIKQLGVLGDCPAPAATLEPIADVTSIWRLEGAVGFEKNDGKLCMLNTDGLDRARFGEVSCGFPEILGEWGKPVAKERAVHGVVGTWARVMVLRDWQACTQLWSGGQLTCRPLWSPNAAKPLTAFSDGLALDSQGRVWSVEPAGRREEFGMSRGLAANAYAACALTAEGQVHCTAELEDAPLPPERVAGLSCVQQVVAGAEHHCAVTCQGKTYCWGSNAYGQLDGQLPPEAGTHTLELDQVEQVGVGARHACALRGSGEVWCWGADVGGRGGGKQEITRSSPNRVALPGPARAVAVSSIAGCAHLRDGRVACWGGNATNYPGLDRVPEVPQVLESVGVVEQLSAAYSHACAVYADGHVGCWGDNQFGALGQGNTAAMSGVVTVPGIDDALEVSAGLLSTCVRRSDGSVWCWGERRDANGKQTFAPSAVFGVRDAVEVVAGSSYGCIRQLNGQISCFEDLSTPPHPVDVSNTTKLVPAGSTGGMCALDAMGKLHCWGKPASNPLYEGLLELTEVRDASIGSRFGCALTDNHVVCVGENVEGQLGDGRLLQSTRAIEIPRPEGGSPL